MKKTILIFIAAVMAIAGVSAQNIFFGTKEGMSLEYANLNGKRQTLGYTHHTIKQVEGSGANMTISYTGQSFDKYHVPNGGAIPFTMSIKNGVMEWDMRGYAAPGTVGGISVEGDQLRMPTSMKVGDRLEDVSFVLTINMGIRIRMSITLSDQECLAIEEVTVKAGTFHCHKLTQTSTLAGRKPTVTKVITWYAPNIGAVKSETYNAKNQLTGITELQSVK